LLLIHHRLLLLLLFQFVERRVACSLLCGIACLGCWCRACVSRLLTSARHLGSCVASKTYPTHLAAQHSATRAHCQTTGACSERSEESEWTSLFNTVIGSQHAEGGIHGTLVVLLAERDGTCGVRALNNTYVR